MKKDELLDQLKQRSEKLRQELTQLQEAFNLKKEQYIKVEGALEALLLLDSDSEVQQPEGW